MVAPKSTNSLGLDIENLKIVEASQNPTPGHPISDEPTPSTETDALKSDTVQAPKENETKPAPSQKKDPYVNHERVKTGGVHV